MFSQLKHHDHGDRSRGLARLTRSLPGLSIMVGRFARIAAGRVREMASASCQSQSVMHG